MRAELDAVIVGSGPNGLAAAVTMAAAGLKVQVIEGAPTIGGGCRTEELTLPGFRHDVCSAGHPLALASSFFRRFDLAARGVTFARPELEFAHPLDGGRAAVVSRSVADTAARLGVDGPSYQRLFGPMVEHADDLCDTLLAPLRTLPAHPLVAASYGRRAVLPASAVARRWQTDEARAILAGAAVHAMMPLTAAPTAGIGLRSNEDCRRAGTLHLGGPFEQLAAGEAEVAAGKHPRDPYVLVVQPGVADPSRAPAGQQTLWTYCHVPSGSDVDMTDRIEEQIDRFAPGFRDLILARSVRTAADEEAHNPNYVGGDIGVGLQTIRQTLFRPVVQWNPYRTPIRGVYLCSSATPPIPGVHGRCGELAALTALRDMFGVREIPDIGPARVLTSRCP
jgi:phytoene dehydrogenase-like protein